MILPNSSQKIGKRAFEKTQLINRNNQIDTKLEETNNGQKIIDWNIVLPLKYNTYRGYFGVLWMTLMVCLCKFPLRP